jgi:hypothetical protein
VLEAAPSGVRISHPRLPAATSGSPGAASKYGQRPWLTFPRAQIPPDDLAASRGLTTATRSRCPLIDRIASGQDHAWPAQDDFHAAEAVARLQQAQGSRIDPVHVTVVGEAYRDHGGSRASAERTGGSDARIWWKQHRAQSRDNRPGKRLPLHQGPQPGTAAADRPHPGPEPGPASPSGGCIEGEANRADLTAGPGSASCRLDAA